MNNVHGPGASRSIADELLASLDAHGYRGKIVPIDRLKNLQTDIEGHRQAGRLCSEFFEERLSHFDFDVIDSRPSARSVIIVAAPQPHLRMTFRWQGRSLAGIVPPTYCHEIDKQVTNLLREVLSSAGFDLFQSSLPLKLLAVQSGLAKYGKNNLAFVDGMGSYCRLMAFYTDIPGVDTRWAEPAVLAQCEKCTACLKKCPTKAIPTDRFLIRAERCLTFHNERQQDFPGWIDSAWHHCLVGCLYCQAFCPVNRKVKVQVENGTIFSETETELILRGAAEDELPQETRRKLEPAGFLQALPELARNLRMLVDYPENANRGWGLVKNSANTGVT